MAKNSIIPTKKDWGVLPKNDLDAYAAFEEFFGKSTKEMEQSFVKFPIEMVDSLRWMPVIPFHYYMVGFSNFILTENFNGVERFDICDMFSAFLNLVEDKLTRSFNSIAPIMDRVIPAIKLISKKQESYNLDIDIYGDFSEKEKNILMLWSKGKTGYIKRSRSKSY